MNPSSNHRVVVTDSSDGVVVADAIRFVSVTTSGTGLMYVHSDHLGTPQKMTNESQALVWDAVYEPFGEVHAITGSATNNQGFPGQYFDQESGFSYNYFRDYDSTTGRYVESDPIGLRGGINTYAYVGNSPPTGFDRFGLKKKQYNNQTAAARAATAAANPASIKGNVEYCGNVCKDQNTGKYFTTGPLIGSLAGCNPTQAPCPTCSSWVASWHTHGAFTDLNGDGLDDYDSENFSPADMNFGDRNKVDVYLGTPSGQFKHYPYGSNAPYSRGPLQ